MNRKQFDKTERREVTSDELEDALKAVFLALKGNIKSENREPTKTELEQKWQLRRKPN